MHIREVVVLVAVAVVLGVVLVVVVMVAVVFGVVLVCFI